MKEISFPPLSPLMFFFAAGIFGLTAYLLVAKKKKLTFSERFLFLFWAVSVVSFATNGILLLAFHYLNPSLESLHPFFLLMWSIWIFQFFLIFLFCFSKIISKKLTFWTISFLFLIFLASISFPFLGQSRTVLKYGEPFLVFREYSTGVYSMVSLILGLLLLLFFIVWRDIKSGLISWNNLSPLYLYYSIIVIGVITFIRTLYLFPGPRILEICYLLIPYLVYLSRKDELRRK